MYCDQCGKLLSSDAKFCKNCGAKNELNNSDSLCSESNLVTPEINNSSLETIEYGCCPFCGTKVPVTAEVCTGCSAYKSNPWREGESPGCLFETFKGLCMICSIPFGIYFGLSSSSVGIGIITLVIVAATPEVIESFIRRSHNELSNWYRYKK